jgi:hypothetical protein
MIPEDDKMWAQGMEESAESQRARVRSTLSTLGELNSTFISLTAHGAIINVFLEVMGYPNPKFPMGNAYILPVLYQNSVGPKVHQEFIPAKPAPKSDVCRPKSKLVKLEGNNCILQ